MSTREEDREQPNATAHELTRWHALPSADAIAAAARDRIGAAAREAIARDARFTIVLAGGATPLTTYRLLRTLDTDWSKWHVYFGDERCVPRNDSERNDHAIDAAWLNHVPIVGAQVHRIPAELGSLEGATVYARALAGIGAFDLVLLGLGEDGHTASLFPGHPLGVDADAPDALPVNDAPKPPPARVTLSLARLSRSKASLFLVSGEGKRAAVHAWRHGASIPAALVRAEHGVDVLIDAGLLTDDRAITSPAD